MPTIDTAVGPLYYDDQGDPDRPVAVLWTSLFTDHHMWDAQLDALRAAGWRTLALDPPGHGRSPGPGRDFTIEECARALVEILDANDIDTPVALLGTSWGGFVALRVALMAAERVAAMVLFNTSAERGSLADRAKTRLLTALLSIRALDPITINRMIISGLISPDTRHQHPHTGTELAKQMLTWNRDGFITAVRSVLINRDPIIDALPQIHTPTLIVSGANDHTLPTIHSQRIAAKIDRSHHVEVPAAAHLVPLEAPNEATTLILDFLQQNNPT